MGGSPEGGGGSTSLQRPESGIDDCHADFMEDGVCRPAPSKCSAGTIPDASKGCIAVGVPSCAAEFLDERGICLPAEEPCAPGTFPVPSLGCVPIDGEAGCGTGTWGNVDEAADDVYVDQSYVGTDSDGSRERPFQTIPEAMAVASDGGRIVIAEGNYDGTLVVDRPLHFEGVCPSKVTLTTAAGAQGVMGFLLAKGDVASLKGVAVTAEARSIVIQGGEVDVERVHIHDADFGVFAVAGGFAKVTRTLVEDINASDAGGYGILAQGSGRVEVDESAVLGARTAGIGSYEGGTLVASDIFVGRMQPDGSGLAAAGEIASGDMTVQRSVFAWNVWGLTVYGDGHLELVESVVAHTSDPTYGELLAVAEPAGVLSVSGTVLTNASAGIAMYGGELQSRHNWINELGGGQYGSAGIIQYAQPPGGSINSEGDVITGVEASGIWTVQPGTISGAIIDGVSWASAGPFAHGAGIIVGEGTGLVERVFIAHTADYGILAAPPSSGGPGKLELRASRIEATSGVDGQQGVGVAVDGTRLELERTSIDAVRGAGILISSASAAVRETTVSGVVSSPFSRASLLSEDVGAPASHGLVFHAGDGDDALTLTDAWFEGYGDVGVVLSTMAHELTEVRASGGQVGLALEDGATAVTTSCDFSGNSAADEATDAGAVLPP